MIANVLFVLGVIAFTVAAFYFCAGRHDPDSKDPFQ